MEEKINITIEYIADRFIDIDFNLPIIGTFRFHWSDPVNVSYGVLNADTGGVIKKGFKTYQEAENWASEENFSIV